MILQVGAVCKIWDLGFQRPSKFQKYLEQASALGSSLVISFHLCCRQQQICIVNI